MHTFPAAGAPRGLVLLLPGGGQDHTSPGIVLRAERLHAAGFEVSVVRALEAVPALLAAYDGPVGLWGVYAGAQRGLTLLVAEPRVAAAVLTFAEEPPPAPLVTAPLLTHVQPVRSHVDPVADGAVVDEQLVWLVQRLAAVRPEQV